MCTYHIPVPELEVNSHFCFLFFLKKRKNLKNFNDFFWSFWSFLNLNLNLNSHSWFLDHTLQNPLEFGGFWGFVAIFAILSLMLLFVMFGYFIKEVVQNLLYACARPPPFLPVPTPSFWYLYVGGGGVLLVQTHE